MFGSTKFKANPYPVYSELRSRGPIHWVNAGEGSWLLVNYADVASALGDSRLSACRHHLMVSRLPIETQGEFAEFNHLLAMWMQFLDPPQHTHLRKLMEKCLTLQFLQTMRPQIQEIADFLLRQVQNAGQMEFIADFAYPLPALVMAEMLDLPSVDRADFLAWSDDIATFQGPNPTIEVARRAQNSLIAITEYFRTLLGKRRRNLGNDLMSLLISSSEEDLLGTEHILAQLASLLIAGHETTRNLLGNGLLALLQHPKQWEMLKHYPALIPNALRELLRYESPIQFVARTAIEDFVCQGQHVKSGQFVISIIGAANRDPAKFNDPDILDITRKECSHLAFGYGAHSCIGAALTYLEAEIAFKTLIEQVPNLRLVNDTPDWNSKVALRALKTLLLTF